MKSMTGFGRYEFSSGDRKFTVEVKGVNHRYLDVSVRMPKKFNFYETAVRTLLKQYASRGKVDIFISYEDLSQNQLSLKYNEVLAREYMKCFGQMKQEFEIEYDIRVSTLARCPEVLTMEEQGEDEEELWNGLKNALEGAFERFSETRAAEGENLKKDILEKLSLMEELVAKIETRSPDILTEYRARLMEKVKELVEDSQIEEGRMAAEIVLYADKICTDEEIVRLKSHIGHMRDTLDEKEGVGRKLDFIAQEINREANTILSKANDLEVSGHAIGLKTEIEKIREQIQNIE